MIRAPGTGLVLFDGVCNLCTASVRFVAERDPAHYFRFASLQSEDARRALAAAGRAPNDDGADGSVVLFDDDGMHVGSDAALRIAARLRAPWSALAVARRLPRPLRDGLYALVARNRYRVFGRRAVCALPPSSG